MKRSTRPLWRLMTAIATGFGISTVINTSDYQGYWYGTIRRVQTVDLNILSHIAPAKLSLALMKGDTDELKRTVDSNYGLFGLVVTDCTTTQTECPGQKILFASNSKNQWRSSLTVESLPQSSYDFLMNPPPIKTEKSFKSPHEENRDATGNRNSGQIIGRVYYVRGIPPTFLNDYWRWIQNPFSTSGTHKAYFVNSMLSLNVALLVWVLVEFLLYRKRVREATLLRDAQRVQSDLQVQLQEKSSLLSEREQYRAKQEKRNQELEAVIAQYHNKLIQTELEQQHNVEHLRNLELQLEEAQQAKVEGWEQLETIVLLQNQISIQQQENAKTAENLTRLRHDLKIANQQATESSNRIQTLNASIAALSQERNAAMEHSTALETELQATRTQMIQSTQLLSTLQLASQETRQSQRWGRDYEQCLEDDNQQLNQCIQQLEQTRQSISNERDDLQFEVWDLQEQLDWLQNQFKVAHIHQPPRWVAPDSSGLDSSNLRIAIVGGHQRMRNCVLSRLEKSGLNNVVEIPPFSEKTIDQSRLKKKISECDLVVVITRYVGHELTGMVSNLRENGSLRGEIMNLNYRGVTGVTREILEHLGDSCSSNSEDDIA